MTVPEILNKWAEYSNYDTEQHSFNLLSSNYEMHRASKRATAINAFDETGKLAVLYLKEVFTQICAQSSVKLLDYLKEPDGLREHVEMWQIFQSKDVTDIEDSILGAINALIEQIVPVKQLGERDKDQERAVLTEAITSIVEELSACHEVLYVRGERLGEIKSFSTEIHVFSTMSECLLTMEQWPDSMYLVYIRNRDTADGYFSFIIKSKGNLLEITERVEEMYPGQHSVMRGRWAENKKYNLFPYQIMKDVSDFDNHGYALKYKIDESELKLFNLGPEAYVPLVLSMVMLANKYSGMDLSDRKISYIDAMLPKNLAMLQEHKETALTIPEGSLVVKTNQEYAINLTSESVLKGTPAAMLDNQNTRKEGIEKSYLETGCFPNHQNIFIDLYGKGFTLNTDALFARETHLYLPNGSLTAQEKMNFEFIGGKDRFDLIAYKKAREQLAEHIRDNMLKEYLAFGGIDAVNRWFEEQIIANKEKIFACCASVWQRYSEDMDKSAEKSGRERIWDMLSRDRFLNGIETNVNTFNPGWAPGSGSSASYNYAPFNMNSAIFNNGRRVTCASGNGSKATIRIHLRFTSWEQMADIFGMENIPTIMKGYQADGHRGSGNPNLDCVDACDYVGTVFERREIQSNKRLWTKANWKSYYWDHKSQYPDWMTREAPNTAMARTPSQSFGVMVAFSKSGIKKLVKVVNERGQKNA